jgi:Flp pilus assembly protein TadD
VPRERLIAEYRTAQAENADRPEAHYNLGLIETALGRHAEAERAFRNALKVDPLFVPAAVNLAGLMQATGRDAEGEPILRDVVLRLPNDPGARLALGLWLIRNGHGDEGFAELKASAKHGEAAPRFAYVYAVALADRGETADAMTVLRESLLLHPYDRDTLMALAIYERQAGDTGAALGHAELLAELEPDDPSIRDFVAQLRQ